MTPQERAESVWRAWQFSSAWEEEDIALLATAIRDAVAEEREACALIADNACYLGLSAKIAAEIRERGEQQ